MEVLGNGSPIKDNENQASGGNYPCRLSRDLNIGSSTTVRSKGEADVRLLLACKAQLSSEVVRLKTDCLRLQKERDAARIRMKELDQMVGKFLDRTRELENRLSIAEDENKRLRGKMLDSSNVCALKKLSVSLDKFHSYPWSENQSNSSERSSSSCLNTLDVKKNPPPQEDWKEVSQKLLEQMKQEMKELKQLSNNFSLQESDNGSTHMVVQEISDSKICDDEVEESLLSLKSETESLKHCLLHQRKTLKSLMNDIMQGNGKELSKDEVKTSRTLQTTVDQSGTSVKPKSSVSQYARLSDDSFRAFFTKHLDADKMSKTVQHFMHTNSHNAPESSKSTSKITSPKGTKPRSETDKQSHDKRFTEEERVCPICQESFHESVPQSEFEKHVLDHLEEESASLLDQYVVL